MMAREWTARVPAEAEWLLRWQTPAVACVVYLTTVFSLKLWIANRGKPVPISAAVVALHNLLIAAWSLVMFLGAFRVIFRQCWQGVAGIEFLYCDPLSSTDGSDGSTGGSETLEGEAYFWLWMYYVSKFYELLDTVVIVLKRRPLIFLHWYHHCIIVPVTFAWLTYRMRFAIIGMAFNTLVHVFMYTFYGASSLRRWADTGANSQTLIGRAVVHVCESWKSRITSFQIIQFVSSFVLSVPYVWYALSWREDGSWDVHCKGIEPFLVSVLMNSSFLFMFVRFYIKAYTSKKSKTG